MLSKEQVLRPMEESTIYLIDQGFVKRYFISHKGTLAVQVIYGRGDIFPLTVAFKVLFDQDIYQGPEMYYYQGMTDVRLYSLSAQALARYTPANPLLYRDLLKNAGKRFHSNIQFLENLNMNGAYAKTAHQLVYFAQRFGELVPKGVQITLLLTHQDIADIIGTTRETVTTSMIKLRCKNLIEGERHIIVRNIDALTTEAYT